MKCNWSNIMSYLPLILGLLRHSIATSGDGYLDGRMQYYALGKESHPPLSFYNPLYSLTTHFSVGIWVRISPHVLTSDSAISYLFHCEEGVIVGMQTYSTAPEDPAVFYGFREGNGQLGPAIYNSHIYTSLGTWNYLSLHHSTNEDCICMGTECECRSNLAYIPPATDTSTCTLGGGEGDMALFKGDIRHFGVFRTVATGDQLLYRMHSRPIYTQVTLYISFQGNSIRSQFGILNINYQPFIIGLVDRENYPEDVCYIQGTYNIYIYIYNIQ